MLFGFKFAIGAVGALLFLWVAWQLIGTVVLFLHNIRVSDATACKEKASEPNPAMTTIIVGAGILFIALFIAPVVRSFF